MHHLAAADAWIAFSARIIGESSEAYSIELTLLKERMLVDPVHTTRYLRNHDPELEWLIRHHLVLARKCGGEREREAAGVIEGFILQESL